MHHSIRFAIFIVLACLAQQAAAQSVIDLRTRPGITQRILVLPSPEPKATVILFAGGSGGLQITPQGGFKWGGGNFLIRTRQMFADNGLYVVVVDAPSDRQRDPFLGGFRQTPQHVEDIKATIAYARAQAKVPVWLVGTSNGTYSAGFIATQLTGPDGPDGIVLTASILTSDVGRAVPRMELGNIKIPVLAVHHELDGCKYCPFNQISLLMNGLTNTRKKELLAYKDGVTRGDPCEAQAYHGFNGIEARVVGDIASWIVAAN